MGLKLEMSTPFANRKALLKGLVAGSLMVAALLNTFWLPLRLVFFVGGFIIFLEGMFPYGKELHTGSLILMTVIGGVISLLITWSGGIAAYVILIIIVALAVYSVSYLKNRTKTWF